MYVAEETLELAQETSIPSKVEHTIQPECRQNLPSELLPVPFLVEMMSNIREGRALPFNLRPNHEYATGRPAPPLEKKAPIKNEVQVPTVEGATNPARGLRDELAIIKALKFELERDFSSLRKIAFNFEET
jgi:hypothetical protein